jgi:eukaryotic-like serine/threonine-protein kinase
MTEDTAERVAALRPGDGTHVGPYRLVGRLGQGGMGRVYLARDPAGRRVAVKVVRPELAAEPEFRRRFRGEVERARQVPPFCTAEVLAADPDGDPAYLVVEYVDGPDLAQAVAAGGPLTGGNLHALAIGVATALAAIHGAGVLHRDLKPRNVLLAPGSPKVIDFGIARAVEGTDRITQAHQMLGTVGYMAPERFDTSRGVDASADVFAWGAVVAYAGTGRAPFGADSLPATAVRIIAGDADIDGLPAGLRELVAAALAKDPAARPTARELLDRLLALDISPTGVLAREPALRAAVDGATGHYRRSRRRRLAVALVGAAVLALAALPFAGRPFAARSAAPGPTATGPGGSAVTPSERPSRRDPYEGDWVGQFQQSFGGTQRIELRLAARAAGGTVIYPDLGCRGRLTVSGRSGARVLLDERITAGSCTRRGRFELWSPAESTVLLTYHPSTGQYTASAALTRASPDPG